MRGIHSSSNLLQHGICVSQHLMIPEPQYSITSRIQKLRPPLISLNLISMMSTIELNHQTAFRTKEVHDVPTNGLLAAKLGAVHLSVAQAHPQLALSVGFVTTKALGVGAECLCAALQFLLSPAYLLFIPSPLEGEGRVRGKMSSRLAHH